MKVLTLIVAFVSLLVSIYLWARSHGFNKKALQAQLRRQRLQATFDLITFLRRGDMEDVYKVLKFSGGPCKPVRADLVANNKLMLEPAEVALNTIGLVVMQIQCQHIDEDTLYSYYGSQFVDAVSILVQFISYAQQRKPGVWAAAIRLHEAWSKNVSLVDGHPLVVVTGYEPSTD